MTEDERTKKFAYVFKRIAAAVLEVDPDRITVFQRRVRGGSYVHSQLDGKALPRDKADLIEGLLRGMAKPTN